MKRDRLLLWARFVFPPLFAPAVALAAASGGAAGGWPASASASLPYVAPPDTLEEVVDSPDASALLPFIPALPPRTTGTAPTIATQPVSQWVETGSRVTFTVSANGAPAPVYQWSKDGRFIRGANQATYTIASAEPRDAGAYTVEAYNGVGFATSDPATLSVGSSGLVTSPPQSLSIATGAAATFSVSTSGSGLTYQWQFDGAPISGATSSSYSLSNAGPEVSGTYTVVISNGTSVVAEEAATLAVATNARLSNLSARGLVGTGGGPLVVGFVSSGNGSKQILLRAVGPTLASEFGVTDALAAPELTLYGDHGQVIAADKSWGGTAALTAAFEQVGAFPFPAISADSALLETLPTGGYSAQVTGLDGSRGVALAELYDADTGTPTATLVNISARTFVASGGNILIVGFAVAGPTSETVLIRGVGPSLKGLFGFQNALSGTQLKLFDSSGNQIAENSGWANNPWISGIGSEVGAFSLMTGSVDSALLVTILPGSYTVQVSGANGATGEGMAEIYEYR